VPESAGAYLTLGMLAGRMGNLAEAVRLLQRSIELNPSDPITHINLSNALVLTGDHRGAEKAARQAIELDPSSPGGWTALAIVVYAAGRTREAVDALQKALELDPANPQAKYLLREFSR
jgi:Flp pilus assembly protein TadD